MKTINKVCIKYARTDAVFVDLDRSSGGYPYGVEIERAHDFKTAEAARNYIAVERPGMFEVVNVTATFSYSPITPTKEG